jgi:hypothetical protein
MPSRFGRGTRRLWQARTAGILAAVLACCGWTFAFSPAATVALAGDVQLAQVPPPPSEDDNIDLLEKLGLLEGHLQIGKQLVDAGMIADALPHFGHPVSELYTYLKPEFDRRKVVDFRAALNALEAQVRDVGRGPRMDALYAEVIASVRTAVATVPADQRESPEFMLSVIALLVEDAAADFEEAVERGSVASNVEYHDAMGFLQYAAALLQRLTASAGPAWSEKLRAADDEITAASQAFPSLQPPARPLRSYQFLKISAARLAALTR